jgi:CBS-domain-containing membrane protein
MLTIGDIMSSDVFTLAASCPADQAAWELSVRGFTGAPVRDESGRLVGVLSRSDLADPERNEGGLQAKEVSDLMTPAMFTLHPAAPVIQAIKLMVREGIHRVIVMDERRQMVGIVTSSDVLHALVRGELLGDSLTATAALGRPSVDGGAPASA